MEASFMNSTYISAALIVIGTISVFNLLLTLLLVFSRRDATSANEDKARGLSFPGFRLESTEAILRLDNPTRASTWLKESKAIVLAFLSPECGPCKNEVPGLTRVKSAYRPKGIELALVIPASESSATEFLGGTAPLHDVISGESRAQQLFKDLRVTSTPSFAVVTPDGWVRVTGHTFMLGSALDRFLAEQP